MQLVLLILMLQVLLLMQHVDAADATVNAAWYCCGCSLLMLLMLLMLLLVQPVDAADVAVDAAWCGWCRCC